MPLPAHLDPNFEGVILDDSQIYLGALMVKLSKHMGVLAFASAAVYAWALPALWGLVLTRSRLVRFVVYPVGCVLPWVLGMVLHYRPAMAVLPPLYMLCFLPALCVLGRLLLRPLASWPRKLGLCLLLLVLSALLAVLPMKPFDPNSGVAVQLSVFFNDIPTNFDYDGVLDAVDNNGLLDPMTLSNVFTAFVIVPVMLHLYVLYFLGFVVALLKPVRRAQAVRRTAKASSESK